jgi:hypothetical protein
VPLCQDSCLLNYAELLRQRRREGGLRASPPTFRRWVVGAPDPLRAPCIQGSPVVLNWQRSSLSYDEDEVGGACGNASELRAKVPQLARWLLSSLPGLRHSPEGPGACAAPTEHPLQPAGGLCGASLGFPQETRSANSRDNPMRSHATGENDSRGGRGVHHLCLSSFLVAAAREAPATFLLLSAPVLN